MKVWEEEEVLRELVAVRVAATAAREAAISAKNNPKNTPSNNPSKKSKNDNKKQEKKRQLPFLLILVRKVHRKCYEFIYYPAETYERIDEVYRLTTIETDDGALSDDGGNESATVRTAFEPYYVGKAIFHAASGETLLQIEGSTGWKEALKQKFKSLDIQSRIIAEEQSPKGRNHTAAKAVASAAMGGGAIVGGTSLAATGLGYTAGGITAGSYAASIMATEAAVSGGSVAAGGFTATMQTIGAVGVMASPVGVTLAAAGAIGGLGTYYMFHRRNKKKKLEEEKKLKQLEDMAKELAASKAEKEKEVNRYQKIAEDEEGEPKAVAVEFWVMVSAKRIEAEESEHCFVHDAWDDRVDADICFLEKSSNTAAKALFDPQGVANRIECDPADRDGWEEALRLHYNFLIEHDVIPYAVQNQHEEHAKEDTPLLKEEEELKEQVKKRQIVDAVAG